MTSGIRPYSGNELAHEVSTSGSSPPPAQVSGQANHSQATAANEAVTLTQNATISAQLLSNARQAPGVDSQAVKTLKSAIQNNLFTVSPDTLASAITSAHAQLKPS